MITILLHAPSKEVYDATMVAVRLPDGTPIAQALPASDPPVGTDGALVYHPDMLVAELGAIMKAQPVIDIDGNVLKPAVVVPGHHVNVWVGGDLEKLLTDGLPSEGTIFQRTRIRALLGRTTRQPADETGVPTGYEGSSGVRIFDVSEVKSPSCVLA